MFSIQTIHFVVETLDEDSRDEGCFVKNKTVITEESSSAQTILKVLVLKKNVNRYFLLFLLFFISHIHNYTEYNQQ